MLCRKTWCEKCWRIDVTHLRPGTAHEIDWALEQPYIDGEPYCPVAGRCPDYNEIGRL